MTPVTMESTIEDVSNTNIASHTIRPCMPNTAGREPTHLACCRPEYSRVYIFDGYALRRGTGKKVRHGTESCVIRSVTSSGIVGSLRNSALVRPDARPSL
jgi:hypothetical protein